MRKSRGLLVASQRACPLCHGHAARWVHALHFLLPERSPLPTNYDLLVCETCGSGFADSSADVSAYDDYYRSFSRYEDATVATGGGDDPADRLRIEATADFLGACLRPDAQVLDVGCGNGGLLAALHRRGIKHLTGFDPAAGCTARVAAQGFSAATVTLPLTDSNAVSGSTGPFDLIVLSHVLEHVFDARAVVTSLLPLLGAGGWLYLETPDPVRYTNQGFPPLYFFDPEHINHFGAASLRFLGEACGLTATTIGQKTLRLANGVDDPAVYGLFEAQGAETGAPVAQGSLYPALAAYVDAGLADLLPMRERILSLVGTDRPFALWGAGSLSQRLVGEPWFPAQQLREVVDRDSRKQGLRFAGHTVRSPEIGLRDLPAGALVLCAAAIATAAINRDYAALGLAYPFYAIAE